MSALKEYKNMLNIRKEYRNIAWQ